MLLIRMRELTTDLCKSEFRTKIDIGIEQNMNRICNAYNSARTSHSNSSLAFYYFTTNYLFKINNFFCFYELKVHHTTRFLKVSTTTYPTNNKVNRKIRKIKSIKLIKTIRKQTWFVGRFESKHAKHSHQQKWNRSIQAIFIFYVKMSLNN